YFYYAHYYASQAIEQLPEAERAEYRRRLHELVFANRLREDRETPGEGAGKAGGWNDRVFPRSTNYGTAMCMLAFLEPQAPPPAMWLKAEATPAEATAPSDPPSAAGEPRPSEGVAAP